MNLNNTNVQNRTLIYHIDGSVSAPSSTFGTDTDTGMYLIGEDIIGFATGGVERLRVDASGAVVSQAPQETEHALAVLGSIYANSIDAVSSLTGRYIGVSGKANLNNTDLFGNTYISSAPTVGSVIFVGSGGNVSEKNGSLFWDNVNNRLGIGTTSPSVELTVTGNLTLNGSQPVQRMNPSTGTNASWTSYTNTSGLTYVGVNNSGGNNFGLTGEAAYATVLFSAGASSPVQLGAGSNVRFHITSSGNIGIRTITPAYNLDVVGEVVIRNKFLSDILSIGTISGFAIDAQSSITGAVIGAHRKANLNNTDLFGSTVVNGRIKFSEYTTGTATATLGTNGPMVTTTPFTWLQATLNDGSAVFIPVWK